MPASLVDADSIAQPAGNPPTAVIVYGGTPLVGVTGLLNVEPCPRVVVAMFGRFNAVDVGPDTVMVVVAPPAGTPRLSLTLNDTVNVPVLSGAPDNNPSDVSVSPSGSTWAALSNANEY